MNIDLERWNNYWKKSREKIAFSHSRIYFGYCKVLMKSLDLFFIKNQLVNLAIRNQKPLKR